MESTKKHHDVQIKYDIKDKKFAGVDLNFEVFGVTNGVGLDIVDENRKTLFR